MTAEEEIDALNDLLCEAIEREKTLEDEVERLRCENYRLRGKIAAARIRLPEQPKHALTILTMDEPPSPLRGGGG